MQIMVTHDDGLHVYPAEYISDTYWNGWAMPSFSFATVCQIQADAIADNHVGGVVIELTTGGQPIGVTYEDGETDYYEPNLDGTYSIGAASWTWEKA